MELEVLRHSCSHILANAVKNLYPDVKLGIGPAIGDGFYYDFDLPGSISEEDFPLIEKEMRRIVGEDYPFVKEVWEKERAIRFFEDKGEVYKRELAEQVQEETVTVYKNGDFLDLCRGPHAVSTGEIKFFKLLSVSGAYWRGKETNPQLTRIYGTAFFTEEELKEHLDCIEEAKKRDHRTLGKKLKLFDLYHNEAGAGLVFYLPRGAVLKRIIEDWEIKEHLKRGYQLVSTPHIMHRELWEKSGHLGYYSEFMYPIKRSEEENFILKPMNCPGHILIYNSELRSWRQLPFRLFELGTVYRYEKGGVLHGLLRVRGFTQDDAHIFCREEDLCDEIKGVLDFIGYAMKKFGFTEYTAEISTRPEKFIGEREAWDKAEEILERVLKEQKIAYTVNKGDGAFYGPKIDIKLKDALKRSWQCATVQLDYSLPERFDLTYHAQDGSKKRVVMIHRVILGSLERFMATLIEHFAGRFPVWLSPIQASILSVNEEVSEYADSIYRFFQEKGCRVEKDLGNETLQKKIRNKEIEKVPYLLIVGKREKENKKISVRERGGKIAGTMTKEEFWEKIKNQAFID